MRRDDLISGTREVLVRSGFFVSRPLSIRSISFDVVARRDDRLTIIKILSNVDAFSRENAEELKVLAEALEASPLLIGERSGSGTLEDGIVYSRFSIPIISIGTLADHVLNDSPPLIFAAPGGLYVRMDSALLHRVRVERNISLGTLAEVAGVSRRTIQMYEAGMGAMIDAALRLEEFLDVPIVEPIDPFDYRPETSQRIVDLNSIDPFTNSIYDMLGELGYAITPTVRCPFEALSKLDSLLILTGLGQDEARLRQKARMVSDLSQITMRQSVIFVERVRSKNSLEGTALVGRDELQDLGDPDRFIELVIERSADDEQD